MELAHSLSELSGLLADPETGGTLTVDLDAIEANWRLLAGKTVPAECAAVVKANAYGLGLEPVTARLAKAGCKTFFVADLAEARRVRTRAREAAIYVFSGFSPGAGTAFCELNVQPVINSTTELAEWDAFVATQNWRGGAAIHVDTGMNRLGMSADEAAALAPRVQRENHGITLLMSHLACADTPNHPLNTAQIRLFRELRMLYHGIPASLANSSGIFLGDSAHCDMVRPGAALYGINPTPGRANPMRGVAAMSGRILQVRKISVRRNGRLRRGVDRATPLAHRHRGARLCRRAAAVRKRRRRQDRGNCIDCGKALPDRRTDFHGPVVHRRQRPARGERAPWRRRHFYRRRSFGRRCRSVRRHHRLRNPHPAWPALPSRLSRRLNGTPGRDLHQARRTGRELMNGRARARLRLPELRCFSRALGRPLRSLRRVEHARRGRLYGCVRAFLAQGPSVRRRAAQGPDARSAPAFLRNRRI